MEMGKEKKKRDNYTNNNNKDETGSVASMNTNTDILAAFEEAAPPPLHPPAAPKKVAYTPLTPILESDPHRRRELKRYRAVACVVLEKCLSNLGVIAELQVGDKLDVTPTGDFIIQRPSWYNTLTRTFRGFILIGIDRWKIHEHISNLLGTAEAIVDEGNINDPRVRTALISSVYGLRNLQATYHKDTTFRNKLKVLIERVEMRYDVDSQLAE